MELLIRQWFIDGLLLIVLAGLIVFLIWAIMKIAGGHIKEFTQYLKQESKEHKTGAKTLGAINWRCVRLLFLLGVLIIFAVEFKAVLAFIGRFIGMENAEVFYKATDIVTMFFVMGFVIVVSVLAVYANTRK